MYNINKLDGAQIKYSYYTILYKWNVIKENDTVCNVCVYALKC